ncbi:LysR family transcriptional regulator [Rodentibacter sp. Ppn85]|uniref:LysR family transcriptional regulator n=1 Tax=Rodentibacter sp. Ppn85 TaxID=1908525 RepID=UPI0009876F16|nr:LysR family transcriptional regulator [Rodentibacter sp. Ppn85]OOF66785.1 LysR family transcriptional regulator [Rodentibacter sp. Ppn85]
MNRLDALKYFVAAAENLSFKLTALRFSVSPQVISRVIAELEKELGEPLFKRNTRAIHLTDFGDKFRPNAIAFLQQEERLFGLKHEENDLAGMVRITLPPSDYADYILQQLLTALKPYPHIAIDWRTDFDTLNTVEDQIDIGIRISRTPKEHWVAKKIMMLREPIVATPELIANVGLPKDIHDLAENFPVGNLLNPKTGKVWDWFIDNEPVPLPKPCVVTGDIRSLLQAVLAGRIFAPIMYHDCKKYIENGTLQVVLNDKESALWGLYLYRPYQPITPRRVQLVFEILEQILMRNKSLI